MNKIRKKIFLFCLLCVFILTGLTACSEEGVKVNSANALAKKLASGSAVKINVSEDIILEEPIVVSGEKEIVGKGKIVAAVEDGEELFMITVTDGGKLTVGGSVKIDAAGLMGAIHVQDGGSAIVQDKAVVMNASDASANILVEGSLEVAGGTLKDAKGHNIYNKKETVISGGEIIGSGEKYAGVYNEATLTQKGGTISKAYNNISNVKGSTFTFESGTNTTSTRDGVFVAEGAAMKATDKAAVIENASGRGILLHGQADIKMITVQGCGDTLIKVGKTGVLNLGNGILQSGNYHGVDNAGTMNMLGGNIQANANCGIVNTGTLKVTSGSIASNENKGILNKHEGTADVTSAMVTFTANKTAVANEDKAVFEFAKAKIMMSTQTNIYCYDGTINIHDTALNASTSNNVRIIDGVINMKDVEVKGNSQSSGTSHHGIYMEGGIINAENVTVSMTTGNGIRNKGGVFKGKNIVMHDINRVGISQGKHDYLDVEGLTEIDGLEIQSTNYANIWNEGGGTIKITDGKLAVASSNSVRSNDGVTELTNVTIPGHKEGSKDNIHGIYLEGGKIVAKNVTIKDVSGNALRNKNGTFIGTNIKMTNIKGQTAISNLPLDDDNKNGIINIDGLTIKNSVSKNLTLDSGVTTIKNATLGQTGGNNIKMQDNAATLNLYNVKIEGQIEKATANTHGIMVEGGNVYGDGVQIANTEGCGIRCKLGKVDLKNVTITETGQAGISNSKMTILGVETGVGNVTIDGLTITKAGIQNVVLDAGKVVLKNATLGKVETDNHNIKVSGTGSLSLNGVEIQGTTSASKYGVIVEGGEASIKNTKIYDLAKSGIHTNRENSKITGENVTIENAVYGITGSNGSVTLSGVTTSNIKENNILAQGSIQVTVSNSTEKAGLGVTTGHNVKTEDKALVTLNKVDIKGVTTDGKYGVMAEGGNANLKDVTISNVKATGIRINRVTSQVTGENVTIKNSANAVTGTNGKVVIDGLTTESITYNNILSDGVANFTIKNANLCKVSGDGHNVKVNDNGKLKMTDSVINGTTSDSKYGIIVEGGEAELKNIEITDLAKSGIHVNKNSSIVIGKNITITNGNGAITGSAGNIDIEKLKTSDISDRNISVSGTCNVTITNSTGDYGLGVSGSHSVEVKSDALVTLDDVEIKGVATADRHGVLAEGGEAVLKNVTIANVAGAGIRVNRETSKVTGTKVTIKDSDLAISGNAGVVELSKLKTSGIAESNITASDTCKVVVTNSAGGYGLGESVNHSVKATGDALVTLDTVEIKGVTTSNRHGVLAEGGDVVLNNVSIHDVAGSGIRINRTASEITGTDVVVKSSENALTGTAGTVEIDGFTTSRISNNNIYAGISEPEEGVTDICSITITDGDLGHTSGHNVKSAANGEVALVDTTIKGVIVSDKHGVMAEYGYVNLDNVTIKNVVDCAIRSNKESSKVEGKVVEILKSGYGVSVSAGNVTIEKLTSTATTSNVTVSGGTTTIKDSSELNKTGDSNVTVSGGTLTLDTTNVNGTSKNYGILVSGGKLELKPNVVVKNTAAEGVYNQGGTIVDDIQKKDEGLKIQNSGATALSNTNGGKTTLNYLTISDVKSGNNIYNAGENSSVSVFGGTLEKSISNNVNVAGGKVTLKNTTVKGTTGASSVNRHNILAAGGNVELENVTLMNASTAGIRVNNAASTVKGKDVRINSADVESTCHVGISASAGTVTIDGLTTTSVVENNILTSGSANVTVNPYEDETKSVLCKTTSSNVKVEGGTTTLNKVDVNGSTNAASLDVSAGTLNLQGKIAIKEADDKVANISAIYNGGGTIDGSTATEIKIQDVAANCMAVWNKSGGITTLRELNILDGNHHHGIKNENPNSTVTIIGGTIGKSKSNNVLASNGIIRLEGVTINGTQTNYGVRADGGDIELITVTINGCSNAGINVNKAESSVTGTTVTVGNSPVGLSVSAGSAEITGFTSSATNSNVTVSGGTATVSGTLNQTSAANVVVSGGELTLNGANVNGSTNEASLDVSTGTLNLQGKIAIKEAEDKVTNTSAIYNHGGTIDGSTATEIKIQDVPANCMAVKNASGGITTLKELKILDGNHHHGIKNENPNSTVTIIGGTIGKSKSNNVLADNGTIRLEGVTISGTQSNHTVRANGGDIELEDVTIQSSASAGINVIKDTSTVTGTDVEIHNSKYGIWVNAGETTISGLTTSNISTNNILSDWSDSTSKVSGTGVVTINGYANGTKSTLGIAGAHNVKALPDGDGLITLNNVSLQGTSSNSHHIVMAEGGDFVLNNVDIIGNGMRTGIRAKDGSVVTGSNVSISKVAEGISNSATVEMENLTIAEISGNYEIWNEDTLKIAGAIDADIHNSATVTVEATKALTGSNITIDWDADKVPSDRIGIKFASAENAAEMEGSITLGEVVSASYISDFVDDKMMLVSRENLTFEVTNYAELDEALGTIKAQKVTKATIEIAGNIVISETVSIEADITLIDDGTARTISRGTPFTADSNGNGIMFKVATGATLTFESTGTDASPRLTIDGNKANVTSTGKAAVVYSVSDAIGVNVSEGVKIINNKSTQPGSVFYMEGGTLDINGGLYKDNISTNAAGVMYLASGVTANIENATFDGNEATHGGVMEVQQEATANITKCVFESNKSTKNQSGYGGGAIYVWGATSDEIIDLNMQDCTFTDNSAATNAGKDVYIAWKNTTVKLAGKMVVDIYNAQQSQINVTAALTDGSDVVVDWKSTLPTNNVGIIFASDDVMNTSKPFISLGGNYNKTFALKYNVATDSVAANATLVETTAISSLDEFTTQLSASEGETVFLRLKTDLAIGSKITLPENSDITILDDGEARTVTRTSSYTGYLFSIPTSSSLTLISTSNDNNNPTLIVDGGSKADDTGIQCGEGCTLLDNSGTLSVRAGVQLSNNYGTNDSQGYGIYSRENSTTTFSGVISNMTGTHSNAKGSAIAVRGTVTLRNAVVKDCYTGLSGAVRVEGGTLYAVNSDFANNQSGNSGAAILVEENSSGVAGTAQITDCRFTKNYAGANGGAIAIRTGETGNVTITDSEFTENEAASCGGAISIEENAKGAMTIMGSEFSKNKAAWGGAIEVNKGSQAVFTVDNCILKNNNAITYTNSNAGAINVDNAVNKNTIKNSMFDTNSAKNGGSSISVTTGGYVNLESCEFKNGTTSTSTTESKCGYGDVRLGGNNQSGGITISGKMIVDIYLNQAGKINVSGPLTEGSQVIANWRLGKITASSWPGITFASEDVMNASKDYISLSKNYSDTYELSFSGTQGILNEK
ncbi:MAG: hypothetical protein IJZ53_09115 [Tyzzerella sp.]|nr:hypothetical protein [Tyzzerella sp.]